jgi:hypothetical protein
MLVPCLGYSSTLKMKAVPSLETLVNFYQTTRRYIPEDSTFIVTAVRTFNPFQYSVIRPERLKSPMYQSGKSVLWLRFEMYTYWIQVRLITPTLNCSALWKLSWYETVFAAGRYMRVGDYFISLFRKSKTNSLILGLYCANWNVTFLNFQQ